MRNAYKTRIPGELDQLCASVRAFVIDGAYESCKALICQAMAQHPDAPQPHNLLGIVLEKTGDHAGAMKHFRAAWALDPGYGPAHHNMYLYGTFFSGGQCAFDESDVPAPPQSTIEIVYDERGVGRAVKKSPFEIGRHALRHAVRS